MAAIVALVAREWWWAFGAGVMAVVRYLIARVEAPPRYGLDHEFEVRSPEFVATLAGASGGPLGSGTGLVVL